MKYIVLVGKTKHLFNFDFSETMYLFTDVQMDRFIK